MLAHVPECKSDQDCGTRAPVCTANSTGVCVQGHCYYDAQKQCERYEGEVAFCKKPSGFTEATRCNYWVEQFSGDAGVLEQCQQQLQCEVASCFDPASGCSGEQRWTDSAGWGACVVPANCTAKMDRPSLGKLTSSETAARVGKQIVYVKTDDGTLTAGDVSSRDSLTMKLTSLFTLDPKCDVDESKLPACCDRKGTAVKGVNWQQFKMPPADARKALLCELNNLYAEFDVEFVDAPPAAGDYSVLWYIQKDCKSTYLCEFCHATGVSLIDPGNHNPNDLQLVAANFTDLHQMAIAGAHEVGHSLGLNHIYEKGSVMNPEVENAGTSWDPGHEAFGCEQRCQPGPKLIDPRAMLKEVVPLAQPKDPARCYVERVLTGIIKYSAQGKITFEEDGTGYQLAPAGVLSLDSPTLAELNKRFPGISHMRVWGTVAQQLVATDYRLLSDIRTTGAPGKLYVGDLNAPRDAASRPTIFGWSGENPSVSVAGPALELPKFQVVSGSRVWFLGGGDNGGVFEGSGCAGPSCGEGVTAVDYVSEWGVIVNRGVSLCTKCAAGFQPTLDGRCRKELPDEGAVTLDQSTARNVPLFRARIPGECTKFNLCRYEVQFSQRSTAESCDEGEVVVLNAGCLHRIQDVSAPYLVGYGLWKATWTAKQMKAALFERLDCTSPDAAVDLSGHLQTSSISFGRGEDGAWLGAGRCVRAIERRRWVVETTSCP
jgi:Matrixin